MRAVQPRLGSEVMVRIFDEEIEILEPRRMEVIRRHPKSKRARSLLMEPGERIFNPSRETARLLTQAEAIGPHTFSLCEQWFNEEGCSGQRRLKVIEVFHLSVDRKRRRRDDGIRLKSPFTTDSRASMHVSLSATIYTLRAPTGELGVILLETLERSSHRKSTIGEIHVKPAPTLERARLQNWGDYTER